MIMAILGSPSWRNLMVSITGDGRDIELSIKIQNEAISYHWVLKYFLFAVGLSSYEDKQSLSWSVDYVELSHLEF